MSFFGKNIRKLRQLKSYSQQSMADFIGINRGALSAYEEGRSEPKINTIIKTANYFSIPIDQLLTKELSVNELLNFNSRLTVDERLQRKSFAKIPLINKANYQEYLRHHHKKEFIQSMAFIQLPLSTEDHLRAFEIQDLEMSYRDKGLFPKDIVVGQLLKPKSLREEKLCIVVGASVLVRHVFKTKKGFQLKANHPAIEDVWLQAEDIAELWTVKGVFNILRNMKNP